MKKIISILKNNKIIILGVMVGILFGFSILALINQKIVMSDESLIQVNAEPTAVSALDYSGTTPVCAAVNCPGGCGAICCRVTNTNGEITCGFIPASS